MGISKQAVVLNISALCSYLILKYLKPKSVCLALGLYSTVSFNPLHLCEAMSVEEKGWKFTKGPKHESKSKDFLYNKVEAQEG